MAEVECDECGQWLPPGTGEPEIARHRQRVHPYGLGARYNKTYFQPYCFNFNWSPSDEICSALKKRKNTRKKKVKTGKKSMGRKRMEKRKKMERVTRLKKRLKSKIGLSKYMQSTLLFDYIGITCTL